MPVALLRIDDRLIHGQVVEGWLPALGARRVLVVSDAAARDELQKTMMRLALPERVALEVLSLSEAPPRVRAACAGEEKVLVLVPGPAEALSLLQEGVSVSVINVGGMHHAAGRVQLGRAIFLDEADARALREIVSKGVRLEGRAVPADSPEDVAALLPA